MGRRGAFAVAIVVCLLAPAQAAADSDPGIHEWQPVPRDRIAAECGMDPDLLEAGTAHLVDNPFVVVRYGKLCWEGGYPGGTTQTYHIASVTKTFGALLTGMVDARSTLSDEDVITRWVEEEDLGQVNPRARVAHVLSMAGTSEDLSYGKKKKWSYDTLGDREINLLVGAMNRAIAQEPDRFAGSADAREFAQREMFDRLGMRSSDWPGQSIAGTMNSTVRDMARMGELVLQRGRYDGRQLIDEDFVYKLTHPAFEDSNTGYGYLTYLNADQNWGYSTGTPDAECSPYVRWPSYPHRPFYEAPDPNGGFPFGEQRHDIGVVWSKGAGGQSFVIHRGLDMVLAVRDDGASVGESEPVGAFEGPKNVWKAIRPALVALDPVYKGDEAAFCEAYRRSEYAPDLREPWFSAPVAAEPPVATASPAPPPPPPSCTRPGIDAFSLRPAGRGLSVRLDGRDLPFTFSLIREARGRRILARRVLTRRVSARDAFSLGTGRLRDGWYVGHVAMRLPDGRTDVRRVVLRRRGGRFRLRPDAGVHRACGAIEDLALGRSVFGGRRGRSLAVAYRLRRDAEAVDVNVLGRPGRAIRGATSAGRTHRVRIRARGLPRGDVRVQLVVKVDGVTSTEVVTARRL